MSENVVTTTELQRDTKRIINEVRAGSTVHVRHYTERVAIITPYRETTTPTASEVIEHVHGLTDLDVVSTSGKMDKAVTRFREIAERYGAPLTPRQAAAIINLIRTLASEAAWTMAGSLAARQGRTQTETYRTQGPSQADTDRIVIILALYALLPIQDLDALYDYHDSDPTDGDWTVGAVVEPITQQVALVIRTLIHGL